MNELLQKHGCANVFTVPEGLRELMGDISREVLREQPPNLYEFITNYLSVLLITREHGVLSLRILEDLCDCKPSVSEHLMQLGMERGQADNLAQVIKEEIEGFEPVEGKEKVKEMQIMKKILTRSVLDEDMAAKVCQVARNTYRDYWYRKKLMQKSIKVTPDEPWEIAAQRTLELYKKTKPSFTELTRATQKIQAAYRGYYVRKNLLNHLKPKRKKHGPKVDLHGPPIDIAASREIDLGPMIDIKVQEDNVTSMFDEHASEKLGLRYDPMKTITHVEDEEFLTDVGGQADRNVRSSRSLGSGVGVKSAAGLISGIPSSKSVGGVEKLLIEEPEVSARQIHLPSDIPEGTRQSRLTSQNQELLEMHKISFAERPPEVIPDIEDNDGEIKEAIEYQEAPVEATGGPEIQEEPGIQPAEVVEGEATQEIPEDIPDDRTDGDGESAPSASVPSSAPETATNTDVEDAGGDTTGEDEGEGEGEGG